MLLTTVHDPFSLPDLSVLQKSCLQKGEVLVQSRLYSLWGGAVTVHIYFPQSATLVWECLTDYDRWGNLFPNVTKSVVLERKSPFHKRLYQAAAKPFSFITIAVETELTVREYPQRGIRFSLEAPNHCFREFEAEVGLTADSDEAGTFVSYAVQAAASLPIPAPFIQEAMHQDLPRNLVHFREVLSSSMMRF